MRELEQEIERLEGRLDRASEARAIDELATVRRGLAGCAPGGALELSNVRIGFACKQRWEDMVGDDRVRACGGCDRPVFNLSAMTRAEAEAVLATRGLTPCVRFYRRPDGTVMTSDCPTAGRSGGRRLAVVASSLAAAGSALAAAPVAMAEPATESTEAPTDSTDDPSSASGEPADAPIRIDEDILMGIPVSRTFTDEMGVIVMTEKRPAVEWSLWGRLGVGVGVESQRPDVAARRVTAPAVEPSSTYEATVAADVTFGVALAGDLRLGAWGEIRTTSDPVAGAELVIEGLPPHPYASRIGGAGSLVLRMGANDRIVTAAVGFGYVGSWPRFHPWIRWARHVVGARILLSVNRAMDTPHDWSATVGLEVEPIGAVHALVDLVRGD